MREFPLAIVAALGDEIRIIRSKMEVDTRVHIRPALFETGKYGGTRVILARSGMGPKAMEFAVSYLFANYRPSLCLHIGYLGSANPYYQSGDIIVASSITDIASGARYETDGNLCQKALLLCNNLGLRAKTAGIVTALNVIHTPHEKAFIGTKNQAHGIDMESSVFAAACAKNNVPYIVARAVLDPMDIELPKLGDAIDPEGKTDFFGLAEHIIRRPMDLLKLPQIEYLATEARRAISQFVNGWISKEINSL